MKGRAAPRHFVYNLAAIVYSGAHYIGWRMASRPLEQAEIAFRTIV
jgi:hypothetical protein